MKLFIYIFFSLIFFIPSNSIESYISFKVNNEIITNIDLDTEYRYLIALNNDLKNTNKEIKEWASEKCYRNIALIGYIEHVLAWTCKRQAYIYKDKYIESLLIYSNVVVKTRVLFWMLRNSMQHYLASFTKATYPSSSLLETKEPQEDANPDTWSKAYALPFSGKNGAEAGGGSEPEVNSEWETNGENGGGSTNPKDKSCTKKTGMFLQGCVYVNNNQHLKTNKLHECQEQVSSIGTECVFGVRDEIGN